MSEQPTPPDRTRGAILIEDEYGTGVFADTVHVTEQPEQSQLLGPDGQPLRYRKHPVGFDLSRRNAQ